MGNNNLGVSFIFLAPFILYYAIKFIVKALIAYYQEVHNDPSHTYSPYS